MRTKKQRIVIETDSRLFLCLINKVKLEINVAGTNEYVGCISSFDENVISADHINFLRMNCKIYLSK